MTVISGAKELISRWRLSRRFPLSVIHAGATADKLSTLGNFSVMFRDSTLLQSELGAYSYVQAGSIICNAGIGKFCSIAGGVNIGLASHPTHLLSTSPVFYDNSQPLPKFFVNERKFTEVIPRTEIGADVWIGHGAMIKAGVKIGVGAVIGAGAIVTKDIAPYVIAAGNPCGKIRLRFPEDTIQRLIDSRWWELDEKRLQEVAPNFCDVDKFLLALHHN